MENDLLIADKRQRTYKGVDEYGLIGDMRSAALVGKDGSIDWCCFPRFDSPSVFAAILDKDRGGHFQIAPITPVMRASQAYWPNTNILETKFLTTTGQLSVIDFMALLDPGNGHRPHEIHRIVRCTIGKVDVRCDFQPRLDYSRAKTSVTPEIGGVVATGNGQKLRLCSEVPMEVRGSDARAQFTLEQGDEVTFVAVFGQRSPKHASSYKTALKLGDARSFWERRASSVVHDGLRRDQVIRSYLVLQLMTYEPTGATVAVPTTSLPETVGGSRNWDYRYSWLRDSSFVADALCRLGQENGAERYFQWLANECGVTSGPPRIMYGIAPDSSLEERILGHLEGHKESRPVRTGNGAAGHLQLDVLGEVILGVDTMVRNNGGMSNDVWSLVDRFAESASTNWQLKARGVWEVRGAVQHFVYSKVMCWVALDRAAGAARARGENGKAARWLRVADTIKAQVLELGWSERKQAFVQRYGSDALDASNLVIPFVGFLPPRDPRVLSTTDAIVNELAEGPFVRRYIPAETDDGLGGQDEGSLTMLSFWLVGNLIYSGQIDCALGHFEEILRCANHLGLFAEMVDPGTLEQAGNFPQAYSHIGLIHSARNLSHALTARPPHSGKAA